MQRLSRRSGLWLSRRGLRPAPKSAAEDDYDDAEPIYGKPFHGWSCDCEECIGYIEAGLPRPGEAPDTGRDSTASGSAAADL